MERKALIYTLATHILALDLGHPNRVGISGITASGKTTFGKELTAELAPPDMVLVVDGTFLFKPEINDCWDFRIFLDTDFDTALQRGSLREANAFGSFLEAEKMFIYRYHAACQICTILDVRKG